MTSQCPGHVGVVFCQSNGWAIPPSDRPELPSHEEYRQRFINWQCQQQEMVFGYSSKENIRQPRPAQSSRIPLPIKSNQYIQHTVKDIREGRGIEYKPRKRGKDVTLK